MSSPGAYATATRESSSPGIQASIRGLGKIAAPPARGILPVLTPEESTTPDLAELTRLVVDAINSGDMVGWSQFFAPHVVVDLTRTVGLAVEGRDAIRAYIEDWLIGYDELEYRAEQIIDMGNGVGFAIVVQSARPTGSTGYVKQREGFVTVVDDGVIVRQIVYPLAEIDEARAAAERLAKERG